METSSSPIRASPLLPLLLSSMSLTILAPSVKWQIDHFSYEISFGQYSRPLPPEFTSQENRYQSQLPYPYYVLALDKVTL